MILPAKTAQLPTTALMGELVEALLVLSDGSLYQLNIVELDIFLALQAQFTTAGVIAKPRYVCLGWSNDIQMLFFTPIFSQQCTVKIRYFPTIREI